MNALNLRWSNIECVVKPWGFEFELLLIENVSIWCLHIEKNMGTSLHCHPTKKTGYIVASGRVEVEFLSSKIILESGQKVNFRPGLFHKTKALTEDVILLEVETPKNKEDLIRLEDGAGRPNSIYETTSISLDEAFKKINFDSNKLFKFREKYYKIGVMHFSLEECNAGDFRNYPDDKDSQIIIFLNNGLILNESIKAHSDGSIKLAYPGDVVSVGNIKRMMPLIDCNNKLYVMRGRLK